MFGNTINDKPNTKIKSKKYLHKPTYPFKFGLDQWVLHYKTNNVCQIIGLPDEYVIEETNEPAYAYKTAEGLTLIRSQTKMEDGRFIVTNEPIKD